MIHHLEFSTHANSILDSIDNDTVKFLKKYFPKEVKVKQIELEKADGEEKFGIYYTHPSESEQRCLVM